jgi:hypothetical protein
MPQEKEGGLLMVVIRREASRGTFAPDPTLDLPGGARLRIKSQNLFPAKFHEESGDLWTPILLLILNVEDDHTEAGQADGERFSDRFEFKASDALLEELGCTEEELKNSNKSKWTVAQQKLIVDWNSWVIRADTKLDRLLLCLYGVDWQNGKIGFDPDDLPSREFIAKILPRQGKRAGSYTGWDSYVNPNPPKKKRTSKKKAVKGEIVEAKTTGVIKGSMVGDPKDLDDLDDQEWEKFPSDLG